MCKGLALPGLEGAAHILHGDVVDKNPFQSCEHHQASTPALHKSNAERPHGCLTLKGTKVHYATVRESLTDADCIVTSNKMF